jgi:hypothetical protein
VGPTQPLIQLVLGSFMGVKRPGREVTLESNSKHALKHVRQPVLALRIIHIAKFTNFCNKDYTLLFAHHGKSSEPDQRPGII